MKTKANMDCMVQVLRTATVLWREGRRFFRPYGITEAQFNVLNLLAQAPGGMSQRELSDLLVVDRSNITLILDCMAGRGWVERRDAPGDRRKYRVSLSPAGMILWKRVVPEYRRAVNSVMNNLSRSEIGAVTRILSRLEHHAARWKADEK